MLGRETRFRIFENLSAFDILKRILEDMQDRCPDFFRFNMDKLDANKFPKMEYCVQFGESTYSFLCRLMNRFNLYYIFDHDRKQDKLPLLINAENETLFIGAFPNVPTTACDNRSYELTDDEPSPATIADFQRQFEPKFNKMWFGNFNIIDPKDPRTHTDKRSANFDLLAGHPAVAAYAISEEFPDPFPNKNAASDYAIGQGLQQEEEVFSVSGGTKNPSLLAGRLMEIFNSKEVKADGNYLLKMVMLKGYEHSYLTSTATDISNLIFRDFLFAPFKKKKSPSRDAADLTVSVVNAGLNNYLQNEQAQAFNKALYPSTTKDSYRYIYNAFGPFFLGGITQVGITGAVSLLVDTVQSAIDANDGRFSNTFVALPHTGAVFRVPSPAPGPRPIAYGPHTALVIGPDGIDTSKQDIFADGIGRVRVRFPWDPGPPRGKATLPPSWTVDGSNSEFPLKHGENTCWVRVSEGWAGRHYGTQFLPRIGQEVIIDFIAGDPERPIITGRVYNADQGFANLPFPEGQVDLEQVEEQDLANAIGFTDYRFEGLKTSSFPKPKDGKERYHLVRFDDRYNCEQYLLRSQGRLDITAFAHSFETTYGNHNVKVVQGKDKDEKPFGGSEFTTVGGEYDLHVGGSRYEQVDKDYQLTVKGAVSLDVKKDLSAVIKGVASIGANSIVLEATNKITLKVGSSWVVVGPCGVYINGPMVYINSGGSPDSAATVTMLDVADAATAEPGDQWNRRITDCNPHAGHGGRRGSHTDRIDPAPPCTVDPSGRICVDPLPPAPPPPQQAHVTGTPVAIDPGANSIVCRAGNLVVQNNNTGPDRACTQAHEGSHIADWQARYGNNLCAGVPDGQLPVGGPGYAEFLRQSECRAYRIGKACRENLLRTASAADRPAIQAGIDRDNAQIAGNRCS
jgi:uncharacterized protein involved in type VI secretion and phage assembly